MTRYAWRVAAALLVAAVVPMVHAQERREPQYERARNIVSRTLDDLRHIERHDQFEREDRDRYERAVREFADMQHAIDDHHLGRERLDRAAEQLDHIAHIAMVGPREREQLNEDLRELRRLRDDWHD